MIKRYIKILIGLVAAALLATGAYFGVTYNEKKNLEKKMNEELKKIVFEFDPEMTKKMTVHNSTGDYGFELTADGWIITQGEEFQLSPDKFVTIATTMSELTASRILTEELPEDLAQYGLEDPMTVCLTTSDKKEYSVDIGSQVPGEESFYLRVTGGSTIYIVSKSDIENLSSEITDLKDKLLFDLAGTDGINYIKYIKDDSVIYDLRKEGDIWDIVTPFSQGTVNGAAVKDIASSLIRVESVTFIDEEIDDLAKFGFDNPQYQLEVGADTKQAKLLFGNFYDDNGQYIYVYNKTIDQIYIFETASLSFLDVATEDILVRELRSEFFGNIKSFDIDMFGTKIKIDYNYSVAGEGETKYLVNKKKVDPKNATQLEVFNNLINSITGLAFSNICEDVSASELLNTPDASIVYHLKEGDDYVLQFIKKSDEENQYYIIENGNYTGTLIRMGVFEGGIIQYYNELMELI
jgi:hypothetical protein